MILVFSYRHSKIPNMPILDCRGMKNPYNDKTMTDEEKIASISKDETIFPLLVHAGYSIIMEQYKRDPYNSDSGNIAIGCTHGKHRSVAVARALLALFPATQFISYAEGVDNAND